jgi:NDP-sugar pyrophosphorylase family protein
MRALIIVAGAFPVLRGLTSHRPAVLVPCVDRPILQHLVESLVDSGIGVFDFILHEAPREIENFLGDGTRWGSRFTFHLVGDPDRPYEPLKLLPRDGQPILLVHADRMPVLPERKILEDREDRNTLFNTVPKSYGGDIAAWTGSAILQSDAVKQVPSDVTESQLQEQLLKIVGVADIVAVDVLDFRSYETFLEAQRRILSDSPASAHLSAREVEPGIWIANNVVIHPTAQLTAPVFVGENSRIGAGTKVGPNAVVGHDTIIDQHTLIIDSAVLPGTYCGEHLELDHVIVDRNRLASSRLGTIVNVSDSFILSGLRAKSSKHSLRSILSRSLAAFLLVVTLPVVAATALFLLIFRSKPVFYCKRVVRIPATFVSHALPTFNLYSFRNPTAMRPFTKLSCVLMDFLPSMSQIVTGKLHFIGMYPRTEAEIEAMADDWRTLYLQSRAGLVTEAFVIHGSEATEDEVYSSEAYYSAVTGVGHDLALAVRFVTRSV